MLLSRNSVFKDNKSFIINETKRFDVFREVYAWMKLCFESKELYIKSNNEMHIRLFMEFYVFHVVRNVTEIMILHKSEMKDNILLLICVSSI